MTKNKDDVIKWLKDLVDREEVAYRFASPIALDPSLLFQSTVNVVQWVDYLVSKGVTREEALEVSFGKGVCVCLM